MWRKYCVVVVLKESCLSIQLVGYFALDAKRQAVRLIEAFDGTMYFPLILVAATTVPMQGLPNFLVYLRPRIRRALRLHNRRAHWFHWFARSAALDGSSDLFSMSRHHSLPEGVTTGDNLMIHENNTVNDMEEETCGSE